MPGVSIAKTSFELKPKHDSAYELSIQFQDQQGGIISSKQFYFQKHATAQEGAILDVFSKNGTSNLVLGGKLLSSKEVKEVKSAAKQLQLWAVNGVVKEPLLGVFDLKDPVYHYIPGAESQMSIPQCEEQVADILRDGPSPATKVLDAAKAYDLFQKNLPFDFVLWEGSLKSALLQQGSFEDKEVSFLNSKEGVSSLCQCAEFFMNGFKLGHRAHSSSAEYLPGDYIKPVSKKYEFYQPHSISTVFYPPLYQEIYAIDGLFTHTLSAVFDVTGNYFKATKITTLHAKVKK